MRTRHLTLVRAEPESPFPAAITSIAAERPKDCVYEDSALDAQGRRQFVAVDEESRELRRLSAAGDDESRFVVRWLIGVLEEHRASVQPALVEWSR